MIHSLPGLVVPWVPLVIAVAAPVLFYSRVMSKAGVSRNRLRALRWRIRARLRPGPGYASLPEVFFRWGRFAFLRGSHRGRPSMRFWRRIVSRTTRYAVRLGRVQYGRRAYSRLEDQCGTVAAQGSGKTGLLIDRILDHDGPVICSTSRDDMYRASANARSRRGRIEVFNPLGIGGIRSTFSFNLIGTCDTPMASYRMADWLAGVSHGTGNVEWFEQKGKFSLGALLLAASIGGHSVTDVYWWNHAGKAEHCPAIGILQKNGNPELAQVVHRLLQSDRTAGSVRDTIDKALQWAAMPELAGAASRDGSFDHLSLILDSGTLYLIAAGDSDSLITPLIRAVASYVHFQAGVIGSKRRHGRLDPPLLMALDEVAVTCPIALPGMLSDSAGKGLLINWVAHSFSQLEERYGRFGAKTILATTGCLRLLGGIKDDETLEKASKLCGKVDGPDGKPVDVVPAELLRTLPDGRALVIRTNLLPVVVKFRPYWYRWNYRGPFKNRHVLPVAAPAPAMTWRPYAPATGLDLDADEVPVPIGADDPAVHNGHHNGQHPPAWIPEQR